MDLKLHIILNQSIMLEVTNQVFFFSFIYFRWWISLGFAIFEAIIVACYSLPYSVYAASQR